MALIFVYLLAVVPFFFAVHHVHAVPFEPRQIGDLACNIARVKTVAGRTATADAVNQIAFAAGNDSDVTSAVSVAQSGLQNANARMITIAGALLSGQDAPADAGGQVIQSLLSAQTVLTRISSSESSITSLVETAQEELAATISAGNDVVSQCGGSDSSIDPSTSVDIAIDAVGASDTETPEGSVPKAIHGASLYRFGGIVYYM